MKKLKLELLQAKENFQIINIILEGDGILDPRELATVELPEGMDFTKGIVIYNRGPIWLYTYLASLCKLSPWIATYDPRYPPHRCIVVYSTIKTIQPGPKFDITPEIINRYLPAKMEGENKVIALVGPPHSGKSVILYNLKTTLMTNSTSKLSRLFPSQKKELLSQKIRDSIFFLRACPDGEGDWAAEISPKDVEIIRYKNQFNDEFVKNICSQIKSFKEEKTIVVADTGGKIDKKNQKIWNLCTHAIIISPDSKCFSEWRGAVKASGLQIIAEIETSLKPKSCILSNKPLRIGLGPTKRGEKNIQIPDELIEKFFGGK